MAKTVEEEPMNSEFRLPRSRVLQRLCLETYLVSSTIALPLIVFGRVEWVPIFCAVFAVIRLRQLSNVRIRIDGESVLVCNFLKSYRCDLRSLSTVNRRPGRRLFGHADFFSWSIDVAGTLVPLNALDGQPSVHAIIKRLQEVRG